MKLFLILYADDTAILEDSEQAMQIFFNVFQIYCRKWRLKLNYDKSKVIVFSNRKVNKNKINLSIEGHVLPLEDEYKYLGIIF